MSVRVRAALLSATCLALCIGYLVQYACAAASITISSDLTHVSAGELIQLSVSVQGVDSNGTMLLLWPFVDGKQWGAYLNMSAHLSAVSPPASGLLGGALLTVQAPLPLPNEGTHSIVVALLDPPPSTAFPVGTALPSGATTSNAVTVSVASPPPAPQRGTNASLVLMEWEPWFTAHNDEYAVAEAVPIVGNYDSFNLDVIKQHWLWFRSLGVDGLLVDWTNNLWGQSSWSSRGVFAQELINATTATLEAYAHFAQQYRTDVPRFILILGLDNGPKASINALNGELEFVYRRYYTKYPDMFFIEDGKPLVLMFDGGNIHSTLPPFNASAAHFTLRWMAAQLQASHLNQKGFWSWMDGSRIPTITNQSGVAEALTATPAYFNTGGWLSPTAGLRANGATFAEQLWYAITVAHPKYLVINQWNEFAGQAQGHGYGPNHSIYVDCYDIPRSNDIEPTCLTCCGYRGCTALSPMPGYGFLYVNILRNVVAAMRNPSASAGPTAAASLGMVIISSPLSRSTVSAPNTTVTWTLSHITPASTTHGYNIYTNDALVAKAEAGDLSATLDLTATPCGNLPAAQSCAIRVVSLDYVAYYPLAYESMRTSSTLVNAAFTLHVFVR